MKTAKRGAKEWRNKRHTTKKAEAIPWVWISHTLAGSPLDPSVRALADAGGQEAKLSQERPRPLTQCCSGKGAGARRE